MKFEMPKINISKFEKENILTSSGMNEDEKLAMTNEAVMKDLGNKNVTAANVFAFTF